MAPPVASAKASLSYPLYAADFDPHNYGFLLVGGGGGEGRSGVGNKIVRQMLGKDKASADLTFGLDPPQHLAENPNLGSRGY